MEKLIPQKFGRILILAGIIGLIVSAIMSYTIYANTDRGALPAASFLTIMLGLVFHFPSMLEENDSGRLSTMRVVVFTVVMVFAVVYIKLGWNAGTFDEFRVDSTWIYILGLTFGGKAIQKFGEETKSDDAPESEKDLDDKGNEKVK